MARTREELDVILEQLEASLPQLIKDTNEYNFVESFAGQTDVVGGADVPDDAEHVRGRANCMPSSLDLIPGDNEGEPCTTGRNAGASPCP